MTDVRNKAGKILEKYFMPEFVQQTLSARQPLSVEERKDAKKVLIELLENYEADRLKGM